MELDLSRNRRPNGRFGWGWIDRRIMSEGHLTPLKQSEVVMYLFLCLVADQHGVSWYGSRAVSRLVKHAPNTIEQALVGLARRNLIAVAGRFVQVLDVDIVVPRPADPAMSPVQRLTPSPAAPPDAMTAHEHLAQLPAEKREEVLRRARQQMARFLGLHEPSPSALEAVAVGLLTQGDR